MELRYFRVLLFQFWLRFDLVVVRGLFHRSVVLNGFRLPGTLRDNWA